GAETPTSGYVKVNGVDIHAEKDKIEGLIGFVSQDDLLIEELTVYQNLYYNAKLCFDNYNEEQIAEAVNKTLLNLGLHEIKDMKVGSPLNKKISGGQRKRLNIALELIREPAILFLDEPTSGLSSRDSENILDLLKELTLKGKLVFVVIHQPSSDIFKMFDKLLILDTGGYLIYNGDPIESIIYFKSRIQHANWNESECTLCGNVNPEQVFNIVEANVLDEYGNPTRSRKISPTEWQAHFKHTHKQQHNDEDIPKELPSNPFKIPGWVKQLTVFIRRDVLSKLSNTQYLVINIAEAPVLAFLLSYIIKYYNVDVANQIGYNLLENSNLPVYIFMSVIVAFFIGLTVSAEEIIKDRKIQKREAFLNLSWSSYLVSKVVILLSISAFQALLFVLVGNTILEIKGMYFYYWLALFSTWV
ncbi:MAG TPA: ATP-binding cassette domain-containing protein, partial [Tenuifilaceae bacterium]|nr:ATP-binding cassette domain-containing protein [Tenuifilaceae bacterium]